MFNSAAAHLPSERLSDCVAAPRVWSHSSAPLVADPDVASAFEQRRRSFVRLGQRRPLERVAALLVAISRNNAYEGRDPSAIPDSLTSGFVADLLGLSVADLANVLVELDALGLVAAAPSSGLQLTNCDGLERLAQAQ